MLVMRYFNGLFRKGIKIVSSLSLASPCDVQPAMLLSFTFSFSLLALASAANMNNGGVPYTISNPPGSTAGWHGHAGKYSTSFEDNIEGKVEHFDVYGEVHTRYSQVYWTRNTPIDLPPALVKRFEVRGRRGSRCVC